MSEVEKRRLLSAVLKARERADELKKQATDVQARAVSAALSAGVSPVDIAAALGVTKARVYQIRDGR